MRFSRLGVVAALAAVLVAPVALAGSAAAGTRVILDQAGDAGGAQKLDITKVKVRNGAHRIVVQVRFAKATAGDLIVSVDPRGATGLRLVAQRNRSGEIKSRVLPWAFTDQHPGGVGEPCTDMRVRWKEDVARLVLPARCLHDGDYGAIRFAVLTENGSDSDWAPETRSGNLGVSDWTPRG